MNRTLILLMIAHAVAAAEVEVVGNAETLAKALPGVPRTTEISVRAMVQVPAGTAIVSVAVETENRSLAEALKENEELRFEFVDGLAKQGITPDQIKSDRFSSTPERGRFSGKIRNYVVHNRMRITVTDEEQLQAVAALVDREKEFIYKGLSPEEVDDKAHRMMALTLACDKLLRQKREVEETLGVNLVVKQIVPNPPSDHHDLGFGDKTFMAQLTAKFEIVKP